MKVPVTDAAFFSSGRGSFAIITSPFFLDYFLLHFLSSFTVFIASTGNGKKESQRKQKLRLCAFLTAQGLKGRKIDKNSIFLKSQARLHIGDLVH